MAITASPLFDEKLARTFAWIALPFSV